MDNLIGKIIGDCKIQKTLGSGGMGCVFKAHHIKLDIPVAIKVLNANLASSKDLIERFIREARVTARIDSPNVVKVAEVDMQDGIFYIRMEYVEGQDLATILKNRVPLPIPEALKYMHDIALGLEAAHSQGIIHRDIKPQNVLVSNKGVLKLVDFGLGRYQEDGDQQLTATGQILGTFYYMPPEQCQGNKADTRSDIYSLGITFYYMITGQFPFTGNTDIVLAMAHVQQQAPLPSAIHASIPKDIEQMTLKMISKQPEDRYQTAADLLQALPPLVAKYGSIDKTVVSQYVSNSVFHRQTEEDVDSRDTILTTHGAPDQSPPSTIQRQTQKTQDLPVFDIPSTKTPPRKNRPVSNQGSIVHSQPNIKQPRSSNSWLNVLGLLVVLLVVLMIFNQIKSLFSSKPDEKQTVVEINNSQTTNSDKKNGNKTNNKTADDQTNNDKKQNGFPFKLPPKPDIKFPPKPDIKFPPKPKLPNFSDHQTHLLQLVEDLGALGERRYGIKRKRLKKLITQGNWPQLIKELEEAKSKRFLTPALDKILQILAELKPTKKSKKRKKGKGKSKRRKKREQ